MLWGSKSLSQYSTSSGLNSASGTKPFCLMNHTNISRVMRRIILVSRFSRSSAGVLGLWGSKRPYRASTPSNTSRRVRCRTAWSKPRPRKPPWYWQRDSLALQFHETIHSRAIAILIITKNKVYRLGEVFSPCKSVMKESRQWFPSSKTTMPASASILMYLSIIWRNPTLRLSMDLLSLRQKKPIL